MLRSWTSLVSFQSRGDKHDNDATYLGHRQLVALNVTLLMMYALACVDMNG
jgi:hypothetical protein